MTGRLRILLVLLVALGSLASVRMIHRRKLNLSYSLLWVALALVLMVFVLFPDTVTYLAMAVGIDLPLNALFTGFCFFALAMMFYLTCIVSRLNEQNRTLTQTLALLEKRVRELEAEKAEK